nr:NACHT domain-containing protein [Corallococcus exiguus]
MGAPGAGKTTLLQHIALAFARERTGDKKLRRKKSLTNSLGKIAWKTPIFIRLTSIASQLATRADNRPDLTVLDALTSTLPPDLQAIPEAKNYFASQLKKGRCVVLLDGLDEVPSNQEFEATTRAIQSMVAFYPKNKYIITSRVAGWRTGAGPGFQVSYVDDLSNTQIETFVDTWYEAVERNAIPGRLEDESPSEKKARSRRSTQKAQSLKSTLQTNIGIRRLATNPMLLSIIAVVHRSLATLPRERSKLYNQCSQILLDQWDVFKGLRIDDTGLRLEQKQAIMRRLAYALHTGEIGDPGGGREAPSEQFEKIISNMLPGLSKPPESASHLLRRLLERSGLLIERSRNSISFAHHTFQEYFTAQYLSDLDTNAGAEFLATQERILSDWWREVALLLSGLLPDSGQFIKLIEQTGHDDVFLQTTRMAALCASEAIAISDKNIRDSIIQRALTVRQTHDSPRIPQTGPIGDYVLRWAKSPTWLSRAAQITHAVSPDAFKLHLRSITSSGNTNHNPETLEAILGCLCSGKQTSTTQEELALLKAALKEDNHRHRSLSLKALGRPDISDLRSIRLEILTAQLATNDRYTTIVAANSIGNILRSSTPIPKDLVSTIRGIIQSNTNKPSSVIREIATTSRRTKFTEAVFDEVTTNLVTTMAASTHSARASTGLRLLPLLPGDKDTKIRHLHLALSRIGDTNKSIQTSAITATREFASKGPAGHIASHIFDQLQSSSTTTNQERYLNALSRLPSSKATPAQWAIIKHLATTSPRKLRAIALSALQVVHPPDNTAGTELLDICLMSSSSLIRSTALKSLTVRTHLKNTKITDALISSLNSRSAENKLSAAATLLRLTEAELPKAICDAVSSTLQRELTLLNKVSSPLLKFLPPRTETTLNFRLCGLLIETLIKHTISTRSSTHYSEILNALGSHASLFLGIIRTSEDNPINDESDEPIISNEEQHTARQSLVHEASISFVSILDTLVISSPEIVFLGEGNMPTLAGRIRSLVRSMPVDVVHRISKELYNSSSISSKIASMSAISALAYRPDSATTAILAEAITDRDVRIARAACIASAMHAKGTQAPDLFRALQRRLDDSDSSLQDAAWTAISSIFSKPDQR